MSNEITFQVPSASQLFAIDSRGWLVAALLLGVALLSSISLALYRRHYTAKNAEQLAKHWTAILLAVFSGVYSLAGYVILLAQNNESTLHSLLSGFPFAEKHVFTVVGIAYFLYNLKNNKVFKAIVSPLTKWSGAKEVTPVTATPLVDLPQQTPVVASEDPLV